VSLSKAPIEQSTVLDVRLFAIRLDVVKATSFDIKCIILITDFLGVARRAVNAFVHLEQTYSLIVVYTLRDFFIGYSDHSIDFWDCLSKAQWPLYFLVHEDTTNT